MSSLPKLIATAAGFLSASESGFLQATKVPLRPRQSATEKRVASAKGNRPKRGERNMGTPTAKKVNVLHHEMQGLTFKGLLRKCPFDLAMTF